jgi:hypothetical protein
MDMRFQHPFTCIVAGPTQAGKTQWVSRFIQHCNVLMNPVPKEIYYAYAEWQPAYSALPTNVRLSEGLPDLTQLKSTPEVPKLLILDDLMQEMKGDKRLTQLFTRGSHHWNLSTIHIVQNMFFDGLRTARVNTQYIVLMKNPSDKLQIMTLAKQLYPGQHKFLTEAYNDATSTIYGYLLVDLHPKMLEKLRVRTNVFPDKPLAVYIPKNL